MLSIFFSAFFIVHCAILTEKTISFLGVAQKGTETMTIKNVESTATVSAPVYFAYGSNLLKERIQRSVNVTRAGIGTLKDYRLDFGIYSKRWNGAVATIVPDPGHEVWGAIWHLSDGFDMLDKQEGVAENVYKRISVEVEVAGGNRLRSYTYMLTQNPDQYVALKELPENRMPSKAYMDVIVRGAEETGLPTAYKEMLKNILHNNFDGPIDYDS